MPKYKDCEIIINDECITVKNSFLLITDEDIARCALYILNLIPGLNSQRNFESICREIKAHNILYKKRIMRRSTQDTDLERKQRKPITIFYNTLTKIFK